MTIFIFFIAAITFQRLKCFLFWCIITRKTKKQILLINYEQNVTAKTASIDSSDHGNITRNEKSFDNIYNKCRVAQKTIWLGKTKEIIAQYLTSKNVILNTYF